LRRLVRIACAALIAAAVAAAAATDARAGRSPICTRGMTTVEIDPRGLLPLSAPNPIGPATAAAMHYETLGNRPLVTGASLATNDQQRGQQAKFSCGTRAWERTIVVYIIDRAMLPAQSASQRVYFVGRFKSGYRVWQIVH
jgi:hypothetical protein